MSERHVEHHEHGEKLNNHESNEIHNSRAEKELSKAEKEHGNKEHVEKLSKTVEQHAVSGKEHSKGEKEQPKHHPVLVNKHLKDMAFARAMTRARKKLSLPSRTFSKVVHNEIVDKTSETLGKTVARPVGLLWGSVFAFIGTSLLLWITKRNGYEYNYLLVIMLFIGGLALGNIAELAWRIYKNR
jgi:hypothetical protein